ncbi:MAG: sugar transferase [Gemmatimonadales bacterium]|nr:sugar transferase [Gemmatimonadales bacterium]
MLTTAGAPAPDELALARRDDRGPATEAIAVRLARDVAWDEVLPARASGVAWRLQRGMKRALDVVLVLAGGALLSPLLLVLALVVRASSPGPILYRWRVMGERGRPFTGYKFRTMVANADALRAALADRNEMSGAVFKMRDDPRVTPIGRWLRRLSLDELPQLWNVLVGDMSLVGPRPPSAGEFVQFTPSQRRKLAVRPGITCLWQVSGRSGIRDLDEWIRLDLAYIRDWSLWLDVVILCRTVPAVLLARGAR